MSDKPKALRRLADILDEQQGGNKGEPSDGELTGEPSDGEPGEGEPSDSKGREPGEGEPSDGEPGEQAGDGEPSDSIGREPGERSKSRPKPSHGESGDSEPWDIPTSEPSDTPPEDPKPGKLPPLPTETADYKVWSRAWDRIYTAEQILKLHGGLHRLDGYRDDLDAALPDSHSIVAKLAARLQRKLMAQQTRAWKFDQEDGILDSARLARLISNPCEPLAYKQEHHGKFKETAVTILVDNSSSMHHDDKYLRAAVAADILTRTLERCGVAVEVLGFTARHETAHHFYAASKGKRRPHNPGRVSNLEHIVYKPFSMPYRRARKAFGAMLGDWLYENVDGEALVWAYNRLITRTEPRKILIVLSDGIPADGCTPSANADGQYLANHLRHVINAITERQHVELLGIGLQHDAKRFYPRSVTITDMEDLAPVLLNELDQFFDR